MLVDGITLAVGSGLGIQMLDDARRGAAFPDSPVTGQLWELTQAVGQKQPGIYEFTSSWNLRSPQYSLLSYDISGTVFGSPESSARVLFFVAPRTFSLQGGFAGAIAKALTPGTSNQDYTIAHTHGGVTDYIGIIRFKDGDDTAEINGTSVADIVVHRGDVLVVLAPDAVDPVLADISITLCGFISA